MWANKTRPESVWRTVDKRDPVGAPSIQAFYRGKSLQTKRGEPRRKRVDGKRDPKPTSNAAQRLPEVALAKPTRRRCSGCRVLMSCLAGTLPRPVTAAATVGATGIVGRGTRDNRRGELGRTARGGLGPQLEGGSERRPR